MKRIIFLTGFFLAGGVLAYAVLLAGQVAAAQEIQAKDEHGIVRIEPSRLVRISNQVTDDAIEQVVPDEAADVSVGEGDILTMQALKSLDGVAVMEQEGVITQVVEMEEKGGSRYEPGELRVIVTRDKTLDLPEGVPAARGVLLSQSGNKLLIGKFSTRLEDGKRTCAPGEDSKTLNILLQDNTRFVKDATDFAQARSIDETTDLHVQQTLRLINDPGELPLCASMLVWGERVGDQIVADVILFHEEIN